MIDILVAGFLLCWLGVGISVVTAYIKHHWVPREKNVYED
jgi:hypothetical protein